MTIAHVLSHSSEPLLTCSPETLLRDAVAMMVDRSKDAVLAVRSDGSAAGIVTDHDIICALKKGSGKLGDITAAAVMTSDIVSCSADANLADCLRLMGRHRIRHLVVMDGQRPRAIVSIRDVLTRLHADDELEIGVLRDLAAASRVAS